MVERFSIVAASRQAPVAINGAWHFRALVCPSVKCRSGARYPEAVEITV
jgi:hypothetical protein